MRWVEPTWLAVRTHQVILGAPDPADATHTGDRRRTGPRRPIRLLHLSDFHASEDVGLDFIHTAVGEALKLRPDLICLTGDYITWRHDGFRRYTEILKPLAGAAPTFAVLGNHDGGRWVGTAGYPDTNLVREMLSGAGIELLHNRSTMAKIHERTIQLVGVGDLWAEETDGDRAFGSGTAATDPGGRDGSDVPVILLSHNPDAKDILGMHRWDLMLSGHTHGGQCDLVFFGTPFAPVRDRRYVRGLRPWENRWIHVTAGVGNLHGLRFNCRPEISLLHLG